MKFREEKSGIIFSLRWTDAEILSNKAVANRVRREGEVEEARAWRPHVISRIWSLNISRTLRRGQKYQRTFLRRTSPSLSSKNFKSDFSNSRYIEYKILYGQGLEQLYFFLGWSR